MPTFSPDSVLASLSLEDKVRLLCGKDAWHLHGLPEHNVPEVTLTDGPHGVRLTDEHTLNDNTHPATVFPVEAAMAATWNPELLHDAAAAIGRECQALNVGVLLGPGLNGKRSPLGGRNFEYFSEDPQLTGIMATAYVQGLQSEGVGGCIKHFVGNEQETRRFLINAEIDERTLQEIYLAPFAKAIREAQPWTVMGAYNSLNGEFCCQNSDVLQRLLREELGFDGLVMSDWSAVQDKVLAHANGLDLEMPGPALRDDELLQAVRNGDVAESVLDERVIRVLRLIKRIEEEQRPVTVDWEAHHELAVRVATEAIVLLKHEQSLLPLSTQSTTALIGEFATEPRFQGGGSSHMKPKGMTLPLSALEQRGTVRYAQGYKDTGTTDELIAEAVTVAREADQVVLLTGTTDSMESEGFDRANMELAPDHVRLIRAVAKANPKLVVVMQSGSAMDTRAIEDAAPVILQAWLPGQGGGEALARVLCGEVSPSGKLSETLPLRLEHNPTYETFPGNKTDVTYHEGLFVGYRYYDTKKLPVAYPFGHGLSYTTFDLNDLRIEQNGNDAPARLQVTVTNTGQVAGAETVQVYIHDEVSTLRRPEQELKGLAKVHLEPGGSETVTVTLDERAFACYVTHLGRWAVESGRFEIRVGTSSRDIRLREWISVESETEVRILPSLEDPVEEWLADSRTSPVMRSVLDDLGFDDQHPMAAIVRGFPIPQLVKFIPWMGHDEATAQRAFQRLAEQRSAVG
ncbi:MAG: glycoside hydrolase family 3 C-terminal domain-containing protein [Natronospirillum sp.]|uniref:beta-glucosidase n=1 Tax=Natronospirillum sp. TaxID=2812955 RepID=UPI0025FA78EC|nr:glycoside hydrolase family 3 C-terminal domain-containing protein [Natronospirillum sp.]MCH8553437.1 glycoside hydrolase family 3 C-terminal domain-containing protein [Natronospirillum sp.]